MSPEIPADYVVPGSAVPERAESVPVWLRADISQINYARLRRLAKGLMRVEGDGVILDLMGYREMLKIMGIHPRQGGEAPGENLVRETEPSQD